MTLSRLDTHTNARGGQMIKAISLPLRSKRIHIGMDEAHGVSEGRYRQLFGYKESTKVVRAAATFLLPARIATHLSLSSVH